MAEGANRYLAKGMMQVTGKPADIHTIVDAGYVVTVWLPEGRGGGMVHLECGAEDLRVDRLLRRQGPWALLWEFVGRLAELGPLADGLGRVIGGADILGLAPQRDHALVAERMAGEIASFLRRYDILLKQQQTGGDRGRRVRFTLPAGDLDVESLSRRQRAVAPVTEAPARPVVHRDGGSDFTVAIGELRVERSPNRLVTLLGSCVGLAIWDRETAIGGLAHVMLPRAVSETGGDARYADRAVPALVRAIVSAGGSPNRLTAKLAGGASMLAEDDGPHRRVSEGNVTLLRQALAQARIPILLEDVGGSHGRRMRVDLRDFTVEVLPLGERGRP